MSEYDWTEDTTEINPDCLEDSDPPGIDTPEEPRDRPRPAVDYHYSPRSIRPGQGVPGRNRGKERPA